MLGTILNIIRDWIISIQVKPELKIKKDDTLTLSIKNKTDREIHFDKNKCFKFVKKDGSRDKIESDWIRFAWGGNRLSIKPGSSFGLNVDMTKPTKRNTLKEFFHDSDELEAYIFDEVDRKFKVKLPKDKKKMVEILTGNKQ